MWFHCLQICFIEEQKNINQNVPEQERASSELTLELDVVDAKLQRNELSMKQQKQEHYKSHLLALLKKLREEERLLTKVH